MCFAQGPEGAVEDQQARFWLVQVVASLKILSDLQAFFKDGLEAFLQRPGKAQLQVSGDRQKSIISCY